MPPGGMVGLNVEVSFSEKPVAPACSAAKYGLRTPRTDTWKELNADKRGPTTASRLTRPASTPAAIDVPNQCDASALLEWLERTGLSGE